MTTKDKLNLTDLLAERQVIVVDINDLKHKQHMVEHRVKTRLINTQQTDLLSVNWGKLNRGYNR